MVFQNRIYIKKVRKFLDYDVGVREESLVDKKKNIKFKMDRYFKDLKYYLSEDPDVEHTPLTVEDRLDSPENLSINLHVLSWAAASERSSL